MTPEKQRIAIAETRGWRKYSDPLENGGYRYSAPRGTSAFLGRHALPDYLNDNNAIRDAVGGMRSQDAARFFVLLWEISGASAHSIWSHQLRVFGTSDAAQWSEAYLKALNKWEECA